jgi:3-(3-hydroxy-phenyl)propionate hydroxylase
MQSIGLADAVIANVALDYGSYYFTSRGRRFAAVEPGTREYGFPRRNTFRQPQLEATLRAGLNRFSSVTALFEYDCTGIEEDTDGVSLILVHQNGTRLNLRTSYLVGADGARSSIRKYIGSELSGSTYDQRWLIVDLASTNEQLRQTRVVCNPARPLITLPGPSGIRRYEFMLHDDETDDVASRPEFVRSLLAENGPDADAPIVRCQVYTFHARVADTWQTARIFLAGDAAHLSPPFAGQGMNSGVRDAQNLGWKLAEVVHGSLGHRLLETYQDERKPHAKALIQLAINMGRVMMPTSRIQAWLVQLAFRMAKLAPRAQAYFAQMKYKPKPFYRIGFVIQDATVSGVAGKMLPQPKVEIDVGRLVPLDDLLGDRFTLMAFGRNAQFTLAAVEELDFDLGDLKRLAILPGVYNPDPRAPIIGVLARDVDKAFSPFLPRDQDLLLLIRPDRYVVAASSADAASLGRMVVKVRDLVSKTRRCDSNTSDAVRPEDCPKNKDMDTLARTPARFA